MEEKLSRHQKYYRKNRDKASKRNKEYYQNNRERIREIQRKYYRKNRDKIKSGMVEYYRENYETVRRKQHKYYKKYRDLIQARRAKYRAKTPAARVVTNLRSRLGSIVKGRSRRTMDLIGCDRDHLLKHLEVQFEDGMTWDNYGKEWVIDHHIPIYAFDPDNKNEVDACWHFSNLRPMWAKENMSKGKKICLER